MSKFLIPKEDRLVLFSRQSEMIKLTDLSILIVGAGALGSNIFHIALCTGIVDVTIMDYDTVEIENICPAFFPYAELKNHKTSELTAFAADMGIPVTGIADRLSSETLSLLKKRKFDIVVSAPDGVENRRIVWELRRNFTNPSTWWIDARMGGHLLSVFTFALDDEHAVKAYEQVELEGEDAPLPCGMKATAPQTKGFGNGFAGQSLFDIINGEQKPFFLQRYDLKTRDYFTLFDAPEL